MRNGTLDSYFLEYKVKCSHTQQWATVTVAQLHTYDSKSMILYILLSRIHVDSNQEIRTSLRRSKKEVYHSCAQISG